MTQQFIIRVQFHDVTLLLTKNPGARGQQLLCHSDEGIDFMLHPL